MWLFAASKHTANLYDVARIETFKDYGSVYVWFRYVDGKFVTRVFIRERDSANRAVFDSVNEIHHFRNARADGFPILLK